MLCVCDKGEHAVHIDLTLVSLVVGIIGGLIGMVKAVVDIAEKRGSVKLPLPIRVLLDKAKPFAWVVFFLGIGLGIGITVSRRTALSEEDREKVYNLLREGDHLSEISHLDEAEHSYRQILELQPKSVPALLGVGRVLEAQGKPDPAIEYYQKAVDVEPNNEEALRDLGGVLYETERFQEAIKVLQKVTELDNSLPLGHYQLGQAYLRSWRKEGRFEEDGNFKNSLEETLKCVRIHSEYSDWGYYNLACLYALRLNDPSLRAEDKVTVTEKSIHHLLLALNNGKESKPKPEDQEIANYILPNTSDSDSDLNKLRLTEQFNEFAQKHLARYQSNGR
jgi:tetratricopeptide (TPR) repeat protein